MKKDLLDILICPSCLPEENPLLEKVKQANNGDIIEGMLKCKKCGKEYPIREGLGFLDPDNIDEPISGNRYEASSMVFSYLWSHYADLLNDPQASQAYSTWADMLQESSGLCLDIGSAVGRFSFDMTQKFDFVIGLDNSVAFMRAARELMKHRHKKLDLIDEGALTLEARLQLPEEWNSNKVEFIVADALALPFTSRSFKAISSLNVLDKVSIPIRHLIEMNRVATDNKAQFLLSDPFSWSEEVAAKDNWLGGKENGDYSGKGIDNVWSLLQGKDGLIKPEWRPDQKGHVWWKIRTHSNHFELIRSCYLKATR